MAGKILDNSTTISELMLDIECELRRMDLWETDPPPEQAFQSSLPFALDVLSFTQWLQFIFVPKIKRLIERADAFPSNCGVAPMAEEYFRDKALPAQQLIKTLKKIDRIMCATVTRN